MKGKKIKIFGVPMDLGQSKRGVDMGPGAVRYAGLLARLGELGYEISDAGNIHVPVRDTLDSCNLIREICNACELVYKAGRDAVSEGFIPIFLGGDHSISMGSIGGISHDEPSGVIWIDAHGDFNTGKTSSTGNIHGMSLAALTGHGEPALVSIGRPGPKLTAANVVLIGLRAPDSQEKAMLKKSGIKIFTMRDIDERGVSSVTKDALKCLGHLQRIHVSLDVDCLDPMTAPGVGTPVPGGLTYREAHLLMEIIADSGKLSSLDIVEINPLIDMGNQTARIAVDLAVSVFGKSIL